MHMYRYLDYPWSHLNSYYPMECGGSQDKNPMPNLEEITLTEPTPKPSRCLIGSTPSQPSIISQLDTLPGLLHLQ